MSDDVKELASKLTDDRGNSDLFVFERTWGHRLLAGVSAIMAVAGLVLIIYCVYNLVGLNSATELSDAVLTLGYTLYVAGLVLGVAVVPPAILGLFVAKHPKYVLLAIIASLFALCLLVAFAVAASTVEGAQMLAVMLYVGIGAVCPVIYLASAIKIKCS